jgi:hypothetical protein
MKYTVVQYSYKIALLFFLISITPDKSTRDGIRTFTTTKK